MIFRNLAVVFALFWAPLSTAIGQDEIPLVDAESSPVLREGATQKLYDVITGGKGRGMVFMDEAISEKLKAQMISPMEAYMKAIDKNRFKQ